MQVYKIITIFVGITGLNMRWFLGVLGAILTFTAHAQGVRVPVEEDILARILDAKSPYYYPPLMIRYMADGVLTHDEYFYLYYGYAYQAAYDAHRELPGDKVMGDVLGKDALTREDALSIVAAGRANMAVDPFSPSNLNIMTYAYQLLGDSVGMKASAARFRGVVDVVTGSGTGLKERSPWHILRFTHANDIIAERGLTVIDRTVRSRTVEYIRVASNPAGVKGYFFDYSRVYSRPYDGPRVEKKNKLMFNGTPVR